MNFLSDFGVQWVLLAAQAVNFLILLFILKKFLYKPILGMLETRKEKIAKSLKDVEEIELKLKKTQEDREKALDEAAQEAKKVLEDAAKSAGLIIEEAHQKAAADIADMVKKSEESMNLERERMHQEIREELSSLVTSGLEKISGKVLSKKDQESIVKTSLKELK